MSNNFTYYTPTKVIFGKDAELQVGNLVKEQGCRKVLVHYGGQSAKKSGLLDRITGSLEAAGIDYVTLGGVVPNPHLSLVYEGIELCKKEGVDFVLAVGGGSVIDSAKAIGYGMANEGDVWDFYDMKRVPQAGLIRYENAKHELFNAASKERKQYFADVIAQFDRMSGQ